MKDYAIVMKLDDDSTARINRIADAIRAACGGDARTIPPHVTLATFRTGDVFPALQALAAAKFMGGHLIFPSVAMFLPNVLYIAPVMNACLLENNRLANEIAKPFNESGNAPPNFRLYLPGGWQPHCTLAYGLDKGRLKKAVQAAIDSFEPIAAGVTRVALAECDPYAERGEWKWKVN